MTVFFFNVKGLVGKSSPPLLYGRKNSDVGILFDVFW